MDNFNLKKFLVENKLTSNSKSLKEEDVQSSLEKKISTMKDLMNYLESIPVEVMDAFVEDFGSNGYDLLTSGDVEDAKDLLKDYL